MRKGLYNVASCPGTKEGRGWPAASCRTHDDMQSGRALCDVVSQDNAEEGAVEGGAMRERRRQKSCRVVGRHSVGVLKIRKVHVLT